MIASNFRCSTVSPSVQRETIARRSLRVYVPFGTHWAGYLPPVLEWRRENELLVSSFISSRDSRCHPEVCRRTKERQRLFSALSRRARQRSVIIAHRDRRGTAGTVERRRRRQRRRRACDGREGCGAANLSRRSRTDEPLAARYRRGVVARFAVHIARRCATGTPSLVRRRSQGAAGARALRADGPGAPGLAGCRLPMASSALKWTSS